MTTKMNDYAEYHRKKNEKKKNKKTSKNQLQHNQLKTATQAKISGTKLRASLATLQGAFVMLERSRIFKTSFLQNKNLQTEIYICRKQVSISSLQTGLDWNRNSLALSSQAWVLQQIGRELNFQKLNLALLKKPRYGI